MSTIKGEPIFNYNEEEGLTVCVITDGEYDYFGEANCHPDDRDMINELTGSEIAYKRAIIEYLKNARDELATKYKTLKHLYSCMEQVKDFNPKENSARLTYRAMNAAEIELQTCRDMLRAARIDLHTYMTEKAKFYAAVRNNRNHC